jgi:CelD/BcsL family acetyltransferase involved in cellulose biosynthesis
MAHVRQLCFDTATDHALASEESALASATTTGKSPASVTVTLHTEFAEVREAWKVLETDIYGSVHQTFDWCTAWADTHELPRAILYGRCGKTPLFLLPLEIVRERGIRIARFMANPFTNLNTGLFSAAFLDGEDAATGSFIAAEMKRLLSGKADLIRLTNIPLNWRDKAHPLGSLATVENQNRTYQLPVAATFEATISQLNGKRRRKKYRNQVRGLEELGGFEHYQPQTPEEKAELIETFFAQKASRFRSLGLPNVFQPADTQAFFHALLQKERSGKDYGLELHAIRLTAPDNQQIAAIAGLSRKGDHVICQFGSITEGPAMAASPGELLFWLMIEQCVSDGVSLFDFGLGDQGYKRSWCTMETVQHDILLPVTLRGRFAAGFFHALTRAKAAIKANRKLYATIQRLRTKKPVQGEEQTSD